MPIQFSDDRRNVDGVQTLLDRVNGIGITEQAGIIGFNRVPPDHNGAVGQDHVISVLNHVMQIYDKSGNLLSTQTLESLFGGIGGNSILPVDPNILYDPYTERFVYVSFEVAGIDGGTVNTANDQIRLNIAVSKTSDPLDGWFVQSINANTVIGGRNTWSDYPGVAVDGDAIYITANMFQFDGAQNFAGNRLWIIDKGDGDGGLYDGGGVSFTKHDPVAAAGSGAFEATLMPVRYANDSLNGPGIFLASASGATNGVNEIIQVFHVTDPLGSPDFSVQQISLGDISNENLSFLPGATQPGTSQRIASGDARINSGGAVWFEGKIYLTFSVAPKSGPDAGQTMTHWVELDATAPAAISLLTQGNIGGEDIGTGVHTYESSINVNKDGSVLINFSASGPTVYPGAYYAFRAADDPGGVFGPSQTLAAGIDYYFRNRAGEGISSQTSNRWGDFSGVGVDPVDGTTFWFFNQYADQRGSPNAAGQDGRWNVVLGSARPTIQNFQFAADSPNERFFGGLGNDALQLNALDVNTRVDISQNNNGSLRAAYSDGASGVATAYFVEAVLFKGGAGDDTLMINGGFDPSQLTNVPFLADGGAGADLLSASGLASGLKVRFFGGDGADTLIGGGSADVIFGDNGDDHIDGGTGNDDLRGSAGNDTVLGGHGRDVIRGNSGIDDLRGGAGGDTIAGGIDNDELRGASGDDAMKGEAGDDYLSGGIDDDLLKGNEGVDTLIGGDGNDSLQGNPGDDLLFGQAGNDDLRGGNDNDTLDGGAGNDTLRGNSGDDVFVYAPGAGSDLIVGFEGGAGAGDVIDLSVYDGVFDAFADVQAAAADDGFGNVVIDLGGDDSITIAKVLEADLHEDDFLF